MKRLLIAVLLAAGLASAAAGIATGPAQAAGSPTITSLSATSLSRSGRLLVNGSGFGAFQGASTLSIGGRVALITRWSDTLVVGYVPESAPLGSDDVQVTVAGTASNAVPLTVTARQSNGRVRWRFQVDAQVGYLLQRPAVGPDGTVVAHDPAGNVYALRPDGGLKWIFRTPLFAYGPPSIGVDGTVYVASSTTIYALSGADGTLKWSFTDPLGGQGVIVGPTVGPDGNIYAATDFGGLGAFALSPTGQLLWSNAGNPTIGETGQQGAEVAFGSGQLYVGVDQGLPSGGVLHAFTATGRESWSVGAGGADTDMQGQRQPTVGPDGTVYMTARGTFRDPCGSCLYAVDPASGAIKWQSEGASEPTVANDGTIVVGRSLSYLDAVRPNGTQKWSTFDGGVLSHPTVDAQDTQVLSGEAPNYGQPGVVQDYSAATGKLQWQFGLPSENGGFQVFYSRPRFTRDGQTAYFGTFISAPNSPDQYAYLYAVDTSGSGLPPPPPPPPPPSVTLSSLTLSPTVVRGGSPSTGTVQLTGAAPTGGAVVALKSSNPSVASVPSSVIVPAGKLNAAFTIRTARVFSTRTATISATYAGTTKTALLTVTR